MATRSLVGRLRSHFNASVLEEEPREHQLIQVAVCCLGHSRKDLEESLEQILRFAETNTDAVMFQVEKEIY